MCVVICIEDGKYPAKSTLEDAEALNSHGGSIGWTDGKYTYYRKGISSKKIHNIIEHKLKPEGIKTAVIHFRIASVGSVNKKLCHPFEITKRVDLNLAGSKCKFPLLFHNGTWSDYADEFIKYLGNQHKPIAIPYGEYSDSRVMAYLAYRLGHKDMAKLVTGWNKIAILTPKGIIRYGTGWCDIKGNKCSNDYFVPTPFGAWNEFGYGNFIRKQNNYEKYEQEIIDTMKKEYDITQDEIDDYISYGYSVYDIQYFLDEEDRRIKDMHASDDELEIMQNYAVGKMYEQ